MLFLLQVNWREMVSRLQMYTPILKPPLLSTALASCWYLLRLSEDRQTLWKLMLSGAGRQDDRMLRGIQLSWHWLLLWAELFPGALPLHPGLVAFLPKKQATPKLNPEKRKDMPESCLSWSLHVTDFLISWMKTPQNASDGGTQIK